MGELTSKTNCEIFIERNPLYAEWQRLQTPESKRRFLEYAIQEAGEWLDRRLVAFYQEQLNSI